MKKRVTFFVASNSGSMVKQVSLPRMLLMFLGVLAAGSVLVLGFVLLDYSQLKHKSLKVAELSDEIATRQDQLQQQQHQIKAFASRINNLKTKLAKLNGFEKKIRIIANIQHKSESDSVFGVGGSIPQDVNPDMTLMHKPNSLLREMHDQLNVLDTALVRQEKNFSSLLNYLEDKRRLLASTPAIRPLNGGWVTSRFAYRKSPFTGRREFHHGLDIAARMGTPVMATADGRVTYSGRKGSLGNTLIIDHGHGMVTRFGHLQKCLKDYGEFVKREEIIGTVGNTGMSTGPHVHYEVRINGVPANPEKYILN